jgi:very-short-patch-repair endonuclease
MTEGERRLWSELRQFRRLYGIHVRRQAPVGPFIVDFVVHEHRLVVEIDGEHHFTPEGIDRDRKRDAWLASQGYRVVHLNTGELLSQFDGCLEEILRELGLMDQAPLPPPLTPPHKGEGDGNHP